MFSRASVRRRLPGRYSQRPRSAFDRRHALLEHVGGRVHDPRVDVPELLERKQVGGVVGVLEDKRRGLVKGHGPGACGRVRDLPGMQRLRC